MSSLSFCSAIILCLILTGETFGQVPSYNCTEVWEASLCYLWHVKRTTSEKHFEVVPHRDVTEIDAVRFEESKIGVLTEDVCNALPHVKDFDVAEVGLTAVDENAFKKCTKLKSLGLQENSLTTLPSGLFDSNVYLELIWLQNNKLRELDGSLFKNNSKLTQIFLNNNQLKTFSFSTEMPVLPHMWKIHLSANQLLDVDIEILLEKCPNLSWIGLLTNNLPCVRQQQIVKILNEKEIRHLIGDCAA